MSLCAHDKTQIVSLEGKVWASVSVTREENKTTKRTPNTNLSHLESQCLNEIESERALGLVSHRGGTEEGRMELSPWRSMSSSGDHREFKG